MNEDDKEQARREFNSIAHGKGGGISGKPADMAIVDEVGEPGSIDHSSRLEITASNLTAVTEKRSVNLHVFAPQYETLTAENVEVPQLMKDILAKLTTETMIEFVNDEECQLPIRAALEGTIDRIITRRFAEMRKIHSMLLQKDTVNDVVVLTMTDAAIKAVIDDRITLNLPNIAESITKDILAEVDGSLVMDAPTEGYIKKTVGDFVEMQFRDGSVRDRIEHAMDQKLHREMLSIKHTAAEEARKVIDSLSDRFTSLDNRTRTFIRDIEARFFSFSERIGELDMRLAEDAGERLVVQQGLDEDVCRTVDLIDKETSSAWREIDRLGAAEAINHIVTTLNDVANGVHELREKRGVGGDISVLHERIDSVIAGLGHFLPRIEAIMQMAIKTVEVSTATALHVGAIKREDKNGGDAT